MCGGGVKGLSGAIAEIKRMYVVPEARGRGVARALLAALEDAARELGYEVVRLDTGARSSPTLARCTSTAATARSPTTTATRSRVSGARSGWARTEKRDNPIRNVSALNAAVTNDKLAPSAAAAQFPKANGLARCHRRATRTS